MSAPEQSGAALSPSKSGVPQVAGAISPLGDPPGEAALLTADGSPPGSNA